jgi:hypothetical protein
LNKAAIADEVIEQPLLHLFTAGYGTLRRFGWCTMMSAVGG